MSSPENIKALKKLNNKAISVPGTKTNIQNSQLLVSTGIPSLDELIGGGIAVGTIFLVEDDCFGVYGKVVSKYFLAEGIVNRHALFITSQDMKARTLLDELPALVDDDPVDKEFEKSDEKMSIAWRYQNLPTTDEPKKSIFGHYFDLSKTMPQEMIDRVEIHFWEATLYKPINVPQTFANPQYHGLLQAIQDEIKKGQYEVTAIPERRTILRIVLHSIGSPHWLADRKGSVNLYREHDLDMFLFCLRSILRSAYAVVLITIPTEILDKESVSRCIHTADTVIKLQSFMATKYEKNPALLDYNGFLHIIKTPTLNTMESSEPASTDLAFKLRRKKFIIEKLHLPPDFEEQSQTRLDPPKLSCSGNKSNIEF